MVYLSLPSHNPGPEVTVQATFSVHNNTLIWRVSSKEDLDLETNLLLDTSGWKCTDAA